MTASPTASDTRGMTRDFYLVILAARFYLRELHNVLATRT
jgi:hypothetical protein